MKKFVQFMKNDYRQVKWTLQNQFKFRMPDWAVFLYYWGAVIIFWPILLVFGIIAKIWIWILLKKLSKRD